MRSTFKILFYLKRKEVNRKGEVPIMCRITINRTISQFSCKRSVDPKLWDISANRVSGRSESAIETNLVLDDIRNGLNKRYYKILEHDGYIDADKIKSAYLGLDQTQPTLLQLFRNFLSDFERLYQSGNRSLSTYYKYKRSYDLLEEFIKYKYNRKDITLNEITSSLISDFDLYMRTDKKLAHNTVWINQMPLRKMITIAINKGWLYKDPFWEYKISAEEVDRGFLSEEEIFILMNMTFKRKKREIVRDLFIFCCFTGLSYKDMTNLTTKNLQIAFDGHPWIITRRQKTNISSNIWLLDIPLKIIDKYRNTLKNEFLLPVPCYETLRTGIKSIAKECGIDKNITWHVARHTYATQICLTNGVPMESLSKMLGHKSIKTTEIYGKILDKKVSSDMEKLSHILKKNSNLKVC